MKTKKQYLSNDAEMRSQRFGPSNLVNCIHVVQTSPKRQIQRPFEGELLYRRGGRCHRQLSVECYRPKDLRDKMDPNCCPSNISEAPSPNKKPLNGFLEEMEFELPSDGRFLQVSSYYQSALHFSLPLKKKEALLYYPLQIWKTPSEL